MTKSLLKNTFREISNSKARFFSILIIIALGVGFFAGIKSTAPSMYNLAETYYRDNNLMDYRLVSTVGFDDDDVKAVKSLRGVTAVMPSYFCDVVETANSGGEIIHLMSLPKSFEKEKVLNTPVVKEGRLPNKSGEIAIEDGAISGARLKIGDTVEFSPQAGDTDITTALKTLKYKIVGIVGSPLYISYQRGTTTVGDGKINQYMYVCPSNFAYERYTELYVKTTASNNSAFSEEYKNDIEKFNSVLKKSGKLRCQSFSKDVITKAENELSNAKDKYNSGYKKVYKKLANAEKKLKDGEKQYNKKIKQTKKELKITNKKLVQGKIDLEQARVNYYSEISKAEKTIKDSEKQLKEAERKYKAGKAKFDKEIPKAQAKIDRGWDKYNEAYEKFADEQEPMLKAGIATAKETIETLQGVYDLLPDEEIKKQINSAKETLAQLKKQYSDAKSKLKKSENKLIKAQAQLDKKRNTTKAELDSAKAQITVGKTELARGKQQLEYEKTQGYNKLITAENELAKGQSEYDEGIKTFKKEKAKGLKKLQAVEEEYQKQKANADKKFAKAYKKIQDSEKQIKDMKNPKWYVFIRDDNPGYSTFSQNADRLDAVASVFPVFFLLVAVLVCVTTMTRLIEEKRTEIGTFKALGYSNRSIVIKFIAYSLTAGVAGSIIGTILGVISLPFVIYETYKIMYYIGDISLVLHIPSIIIGVLAAVICTTAVSVIVCCNSLRQKPAAIMRPKAPKAGKRIFLEYIKPLWNKMNFTAKLTARNLLRYKSRLCMTVIGVAGCCALIVAAFGLMNSFVPLTDDQFQTIYKYNTTVVTKESGTEKELEYLTNIVKNDSNVRHYSLAIQEETCVKFKKVMKQDGTYITVLQNMKDFNSLISLHTRTEKQELTLRDDGVLINEKLAEEMGISVGDSISVGEPGNMATVKVQGIYEQYINNYVYMTPTLYKNLYGEEVKYNMMDVVLGDTSEKAEKLFSEKCLKNEKIVTVSYIDSILEDFRNMLDSLNMVVVVMIICAAALAFVVLYNLTNINIGERVREIATFKVLGFYNKETSAFIFIENIVLTLLGIGAGLVLGVFLTDFIVQTVEIDNIMFGRDIFMSTYFYAAGLTMLFSLMVLFVMRFKIKAIDMVESLKSVE